MIVRQGVPLVAARRALFSSTSLPTLSALLINNSTGTVEVAEGPEFRRRVPRVERHGVDEAGLLLTCLAQDILLGDRKSRDDDGPGNRLRPFNGAVFNRSAF